jgi:predicted  nucleic acid-binding Zn-ribbon protein
MPHQCTTCGHTFADGSKEMLSGCPDCGGNTFQFHPAGSSVPDEPPSEEPPEPEGGATANRVGRAATRVRDFVGGGSETTDDFGDAGAEAGGTGGSADTPDPEAPWPDDPDDAGTGDAADDSDSEIIDADARRESEDLAQSSARGEVATPDEVADTGDWAAGGDPATAAPSGDRPPASSGETATGPPAEGRVVSEPTGEMPDIDELREQLNDQFESIKIVEPGEYELNLMELYNREEYIIALQENGRYVIQVPENWLGDRPKQS